MTAMGEGDWGRLARAVDDARKRAGLHTQTALGQKAGVSPRTLWALDQGRPVSDRTLSRIEQALDWPPGTADQILGREPAGDVHEETLAEMDGSTIVVQVPLEEWGRLTESQRDKIRDMVRDSARRAVEVAAEGVDS